MAKNKFWYLVKYTVDDDVFYTMREGKHYNMVRQEIFDECNPTNVYIVYADASQSKVQKVYDKLMEVK